MKKLKNSDIKVLDRHAMIKTLGKSGTIEARPGNSIAVDFSMYSSITYLNESNQDFIPGTLM